MGSVLNFAGNLGESTGLNDVLGISSGGGGVGFGSDNSPSAMGYGIQDPGQFQSYTTSSNLNQGTPLQGDYDMSQAGAGESFYTPQVQQALQPGSGAGSSYWNSVSSQFSPTAGQVSTPTGTNYSADVYGNISNRQSTLAPDAGIGAYYDRAVDTATDDIDSSMASRGLFNSSAALQQTSDAVGGLRAQEARDNADYRLRADDAARGWSGLELGAAGQADSNASNLFRNDLAGSQNALSWLTGGANIAQGADSAELARLLGGMNIASTAQNLRGDRVNSMFNNIMAPSTFMTQFMGDQYGGMFDADDQNFGNSIMFGTGLADEALTRSDHQQGQTRQGLSDFMSFLGMGG